MNDKLSRLAALRPVERANPAGQPVSGAAGERLSQLIGAADIRNHLGRHLVARRLFSQPRPCDIRPNAFRLLAPDAGAAASDHSQWLFLDTETTGLSGGTGTYAFLIGLAWWTDDGLAVEQYFMRDHSEEPSMLAELERQLSSHSTLVTFNGKSFDWPLLETRYRMTRLRVTTPPSLHLDLLYPARQLYRLSLKSVALAALERHVLAFDRGDDIPSETIPWRYFDFLRGGPPEPLAEVFHHNQMDLLGLATLAVHLSIVLEEPGQHVRSGPELYGIAKMLRRSGDAVSANTALQLALDKGLPETAGRAARRELARFAKRRRDFARANASWEILLGNTPEGFEAYEQLAIYYEHRAHQRDRAAALTREALVRLRDAAHAGLVSAPTYRSWHGRFQHRLNRLTIATKRPRVVPEVNGDREVV
jgi:uncharacterized protein YprB with RNaseH-like and TPR domain